MTTAFDRARKYRRRLYKFCFYSSTVSAIALLMGIVQGVFSQTPQLLAVCIAGAAVNVIMIYLTAPTENQEWEDEQK